MKALKEIREKIKLFGLKGETEVKALFDTGSPYGYVAKEFADKVELLVFPEEHEVELPNKEKMKMKPALGIVEINGCRKPVWTYVNEKPLSDMVLGMLNLEALGIKIDTQKGFTISSELPRA